MPCFPFLCGGEERTTGNPVVDEEVESVQDVQMYSYKELKAATGNFSLANKIGQGGFGSVYKGKVRHGRMAAIKVLAPESTQGVREFLTEINLISQVQHENLVKLYGCCVEGAHRILVYNYLENNSLAQTLLGNWKCNIEFSWPTRVRISVGIARGLAFLHEEVHPHVVHRDVKASNILLDKDLTPKISDFGMAKLMPPNATHVSTRVAGTLGYLAPEYAVRGQLTRKADVYSFGVLLLEIVCGKCNTNMRLPQGERFLLERIWEHYQQGSLVTMIDDSLNGDYDPNEACNFLKIGLLCTQDAPKLRPSMSTTVKMLTGAINIDKAKITAPGLICDFTELKVRNQTDASASSGKDTLSSRGSPKDTTFSSGTSTNVTSTNDASTNVGLTFTAVYDKSILDSY